MGWVRPRLMKTSRLAIAAVALIFGSNAFAQTARVFDNFDRSQGVQVYRQPQPEVPADINAGKVAKRVKRNGKWVTTYVDPLVKKTGKSTPRVTITDALSAREGGLPARTILNMGSSRDLKGFTTGNALHDAFIVDSSRRYRIDPLLIYAQMHQESSFKLRARSHKGASGLMQLMPATARRFGVTSIYDPRQNIDAGVKYMRWLLDNFNQDVVLALAGYNAGEGAVMKYGRRVPPYRETQEYVRRITARYNSISDPSYVQSARSINTTVAKVDQKDSRPLSVYEPSPLAIRTADGKMMLINQ
jgi:soluble lytic murein transglycosylase-like protein